MADRIVSRGSVVLVRYPFTDLTGFKVRPAIILTPESLLAKIEDVLCLFVSSVIPEEPLPTDLIVDRQQPVFSRMGLRKRSVLRAHKLALLSKSLVVRRLGEIDAELMAQLERCLRIALGIPQAESRPAGGDAAPHPPQTPPEPV